MREISIEKYIFAVGTFGMYCICSMGGFCGIETSSPTFSFPIGQKMYRNFVEYLSIDPTSNI